MTSCASRRILPVMGGRAALGTRARPAAMSPSRDALSLPAQDSTARARTALPRGRLAQRYLGNQAVLHSQVPADANPTSLKPPLARDTAFAGVVQRKSVRGTSTAGNCAACNVPEGLQRRADGGFVTGIPVSVSHELAHTSQQRSFAYGGSSTAVRAAEPHTQDATGLPTAVLAKMEWALGHEFTDV